MKDHFYDGRLLRDDLDFPMIEFQTVHLRSGGNALLEFLSNPPGAVFRNRAAFLLRIRSEDGQHQLAIPAHRVYVLFFKENVDPQRLQLAHGFQQRDRIAGKTADAFRQYQIDLPGPAVGQKTLEFRPLGFRAGQSSVCVYARITPAGMLLNFLTVIADLCGEGM